MPREENKRSQIRAGFLTTLIFHLSVLIILLVVAIGNEVSRENSFVLDFTKQEQLEREQQEMELKEEVNQQLEDILSANRISQSEIRNVAVDAGSRLKDDRSKNPSEVYDQAKELQRKLDASKRAALAEQAAAEAVDMSPSQETAQEDETVQNYKGPSVISYSLDGRKARRLPVPAYKGYGSGDVCVEIGVGQNGRVQSARVLEEQSTGDPALHEFAIQAARSSIFNSSSSAPKVQMGTILYRFIAQ